MELQDQGLENIESVDIDSNKKQVAEKNKGQKKNFWCLCKEIFSLAAEISTAIALIVGIMTLKEDIVTRNSSYMPLLKVESEVYNDTFTLSWNTKEETSSVTNLPKLSFSLYNIGNGVADDIMVEFDQKVLQKWMEQLEDMTADEDYRNRVSEKDLCVSIPWMMNDPDSPVTVNVPSAYLECLRELYKWKDITQHESFELPGLKFTINYKDIQGEVVTYKYSYDNFFDELCYGKDNRGGGMVTLSSKIGVGKRIR